MKRLTGKDNNLDITDFSDMVYGKLPPQALELEAAVLGALMVDQDGLRFVDDVRPEYFYKNENSLIASAIKRLHERRDAVDILTVTAELRKMGELDAAGGPYYVTQLTGAVAGAAHIEEHIRIVQEKYLGRAMIKIGGFLTNQAYDDTVDVFNLIDDTKLMISKVEEGMGLDSGVETAAEVVAKLLKADNRKAPIITGNKDFDQHMDAEPGTLTVVAARPGMGKTTYILNEAEATAAAGFPTAFFSLEMTKRELMCRMAAKSGVPYIRIDRKDVKSGEQNVLNRRLAEIQDLPLHFVDRSMELTQLIRIIRRLVFKGIRRVYIDQLRFIKFNQRGFEQETPRNSEIIRQLKITAKELDIPITLVAQISREAQKKGGMFRPDLIDLKSTGSLEEDSDNVVLLWRPEYYYDKGMDKFDRVHCIAEGINREVCSRGLLEVNHAKKRNGAPEITAWTMEPSRFELKKFSEQFYKSNGRTTEDEPPW